MSAKPVLGLFFTDTFIEISAVSGDGRQLKRHNLLPLPESTVVNGEIINQDIFVKVLGKLLSSAKPGPIEPNSEVVVGINDNRVFLREFSLPKYAGKDVVESIAWQVKSLMPVLPADVETDWSIIGRDVDGQIEVLLAAVPKNIVGSYFSVISSVGLRVVAIEPAVFGNIRIMDPLLLRGKNQLMVFMADTYTEFTYTTNGNPRFSDILTEADIVKKGTILDVILEYVNYANSKHSSRMVSEILISGYSKNLSDVVSSLVARHSAVGVATSRVLTSLVKDQTLLRTSLGLSLKPTDQGSSLNLLPQAFRIESIYKRFNSTWKVILGLLLILTIFADLSLFYLMRADLNKRSILLSLREQYQEKLGVPDNQRMIKSAKDINSLSDQLVLLRDVTGGEDEILRELMADVPEGIVLTSLVYNRGPGDHRLADKNSVWTMTGTANSREVVLIFYDLLLASTDFANGQLYFGSLEKPNALNFRIASGAKL